MSTDKKEDLLKEKIANIDVRLWISEPHPRVCDSVALGWDLRICIFNKFLDDSDHWTTFGEAGVKLICMLNCSETTGREATTYISK